MAKKFTNEYKDLLNNLRLSINYSLNIININEYSFECDILEGTIIDFIKNNDNLKKISLLPLEEFQEIISIIDFSLSFFIDKSDIALLMQDCLFKFLVFPNLYKIDYIVNDIAIKNIKYLINTYNINELKSSLWQEKAQHSHMEYYSIDQLILDEENYEISDDWKFNFSKNVIDALKN